MAKKTVSINASMNQTYQVQTSVGGKISYIDQPENAGGSNAGPTPLETLMFALAGCICHIARIVAHQRKINLHGMEVRVEGDLDTDFLMGKTKQGRAGFNSIRLFVKIDADLSSEQKQEFLDEVDSRCPVSESLLNATSVQVALEK